MTAQPQAASSNQVYGGQNAVAWARSKVGILETAGNTVRELGIKGAAWCGIFATKAANAAGAHVSGADYVPNIKTHAMAKTNGFIGWSTDTRTARPGDFAVEHGQGHVEIVESVNADGSLNTIGGNTSTPSGRDGVATKRRSRGEISGIAHVAYPGLAGAINVGTTGGGLATITPGGLAGALGGGVVPEVLNGDIPSGVAREIVDAFVSALGDTGARVLVTGGLVAAGVALMGVGTARALGVSAKAGQAKEQAAGAAELAVQARTGGAGAGATKAAGGALA